jgi:hypothetical protein
MVTADKDEFEYPPEGPDLTILEPAGVKPLKERWECAWHLSSLIYAGLWPSMRVSRPHLDPNHWCDRIVEAMGNQHVTYATRGDQKQRTYPDKIIARMFACPSPRGSTEGNAAHRQPVDANAENESVRAWTSDYAMNPNCRGREDSPQEVVFLFESKPGWNQHGGPELFTFDNHDPKGGLVLLNDGTVKFIRTEGELRQLRWK